VGAKVDAPGGRDGVFAEHRSQGYPDGHCLFLRNRTRAHNGLGQTRVVGVQLCGNPTRGMYKSAPCPLLQCKSTQTHTQAHMET